MLRYIRKRLLLLIPTVILVCVIVFALVRFIPGDAVDYMLYKLREGQQYDVTREYVEKLLGMDKPAVIQFFIWFGDVLKGNLGNSLFQNETVIHAIARQFPPTFQLGLMTIIFSICISIPLGLVCAARQDKISDYTIKVIALLLMSIPIFWIATLVLIYPSLWWGYVPPVQYASIFVSPGQNLRMFIVPALLGACFNSGMQLRLVRTVMLDTMRADYVRTAWAKGAGERSIMFRHAFRNAMIPVVTMIGGSIGTLITGSVVLENIFNIPGMGRQIISSLNNRDYPVAQGIILIFAIITMLVTLVIDISYKWIDPRISLDKERRMGK